MEILVEGVLLQLAVVGLQLALARLIEWVRARSGRVDPARGFGAHGNERRGLSLAA
ncbi:MAG: hypothetical protein M0Z93_11940 [Actinomycetota bacterium]|nr:hypothetical protein [Actinomycetota bacterium]